MVCVEQHWRQGDPAARGRLFEGHLFLQRRRQQEVLLRPHNCAVDATRRGSREHDGPLTMSKNKIFCS
jgi:hypothetical protein